MGLKISRAVPIGEGSTGFRFRNSEATVDDQKGYEEGRLLEKARFRRGSLAQQVFDRLTSATPESPVSTKKTSRKK